MLHLLINLACLNLTNLVKYIFKLFII